MTGQISIIIVNWNGAGYLNECIGSVMRQTYENKKIILVDNASQDKSLETARKAYPDLITIGLEKNYGYAIANNIGIKYALENFDPAYILLLNNDARMTSDATLEKFVENAQKKQDMGILGCALMNIDGTIQHAGFQLNLLSGNLIKIIKEAALNKQSEECVAVSGAAFLIKRSVIDRIGLLDEKFSPFLFEEIDYCLRAKKTGFTCVCTGDISLVHADHVSLFKHPPDYLAWISEKNRIRLSLLNLSFLALIIRIPIECARMLFSFLHIFFERKNKQRPGNIINLKLRNNWKEKLSLWTGIYSETSKNFSEIIEKRSNRKKRVWY